MANVMRRYLLTGNVIKHFQVLRTRCISIQTRIVNANATSALTTGQRRFLSLSSSQCQQEAAKEDSEMQDESGEEAEEESDGVSKGSKRPIHDVETSKRYMASKAYQITYGDDPVWVPYRRNHKGAIAPRKTRNTCIRKGRIATGNPCPICRDEYLVLDPQNPDLLNQFISQQTGEVLSYEKTGLCQKRHRELLVAVEKAWDIGTIQKRVPFKQYDYSVYYQQLKEAKL